MNTQLENYKDIKLGDLLLDWRWANALFLIISKPKISWAVDPDDSARPLSCKVFSFQSHQKTEIEIGTVDMDTGQAVLFYKLVEVQE